MQGAPPRYQLNRTFSVRIRYAEYGLHVLSLFSIPTQVRNKLCYAFSIDRNSGKLPLRHQCFYYFFTNRTTQDILTHHQYSAHSQSPN